MEQCPSNSQEAGKASQCEGCPGQEYCKSGQERGEDSLTKQLAVRIKAIKHIVIVMSGKGGVGKSTVACQLAVMLKQRYANVGILDVDICGPSVARIMGVEKEQVQRSEWGWLPVKDKVHNLSIMSVAFLLGSRDDPIMWRGPRKTLLIRRLFAEVLWGRLDWLIIDTPPGTSDEHLTIVTALKSIRTDGVVLVSTPQDLSALTVRRE